MATDEAGAIWMPVPAGIIFPGYWGNTPKWVVVHKTASAGTAQDIAAYFASASNTGESSTHYVVGQDGVVVQCVSEADGAGGNGALEAGHASYLPTDINLNLLTISIEHVDPASDNSTPLTDAQKAASFRLIHDICQRHSIPMRPGDASGGIIGHDDIDPISRAHCPGNYPWTELWAFLGGQTMLQGYSPTSTDFATWFTATDADHWLCKSTGKSVQFGIKNFYAQLSMDGQSLPIIGLPTGNEIYMTIDGKTVICQVFERAAVYCDADHVKDQQPGTGVYSLCHLNDPDFLKEVGLALAGSTPASPAVDLSGVIAQLKAIEAAAQGGLKDLGAA